MTVKTRYDLDPDELAQRLLARLPARAERKPGTMSGLATATPLPGAASGPWTGARPERRPGRNPDWTPGRISDSKGAESAALPRQRHDPLTEDRARAMLAQEAGFASAYRPHDLPSESPADARARRRAERRARRAQLRESGGLAGFVFVVCLLLGTLFWLALGVMVVF